MAFAGRHGSAPRPSRGARALVGGFRLAQQALPLLAEQRHPSVCWPAALEGQSERLSGSALGSGAPQGLARGTALSSRGPNRRSVGGQPFVGVGLDRSVPRQIVAVGVDQIDVPPDHRPELVGGELSVGEPHAVGVGRVRGCGKGPLARLATSELLEEVHSLCGELGGLESLVSLTREHHLLVSLAPWPGCAGEVGATRAAGQAAGAARPHPHDPG